ncbi:C2 domain-containing protein [Acorus calamus]|uniref:C2 domain-containing protein n=1 Tax=Acorus calamus TaxID=4465 RepID=A0AAV9F265_ACOCL|nr:C2 domain-containing protein [Acorus calamus]
MDVTGVTILHHVGLVLGAIWILSHFGWCHPILYFAFFVYLCLVNERYTSRLWKKLQFEERKNANQKRLLSDSETVRWLNHAVEKVWPICMEQIASQQFLLPIIPWFLDKFKPWTARKAVVQHLYLGRNPPMFTEIRVLHESADDDHLVLELGMNFLSADDMSAILAVQLRKRLGFGMWAKMHITGMHVEGKVLVGVKFLRHWPFLGRMRLCFIGPPYFQMTVKPIFNHGIDVTEIPGIAGWLNKLLAVAFEQTLVEPNMLVVDVEKFASAPSENWFTMDEKRPIAYAKVEIIEALDMKPSDPNGLADPYVKGQLGQYRFRTKIQKKTLSPKWQEEFKIPISSWESPNILIIEVRDKDHIFDDTLGNCTVNIGDLRGGKRHDKWLSLQNIKMGRLHIAITVNEGEDAKGEELVIGEEPCETTQTTIPVAGEDNTQENATSDAPPIKPQNNADEFEPIDIEGQKRTGIWVHRPGDEVSQTWEPRKGKIRQKNEVLCEDIGRVDSPRSAGTGSRGSDDNSDDEGSNGTKRPGKLRKGLHKIGSIFQRSPKNESPKNSWDTDVTDILTAIPNIRAVGEKQTPVKFVKDDEASKADKDVTSPEHEDAESPGSKKGSQMSNPSNGDDPRESSSSNEESLRLSVEDNIAEGNSHSSFPVSVSDEVVRMGQTDSGKGRGGSLNRKVSFREPDRTDDDTGGSTDVHSQGGTSGLEVSKGMQEMRVGR